MELYNAYQERMELTHEQEACLKYTGSRTLMVKGAAGAGKSIVIQSLAKKYLSEGESEQQNKVAVFTFSNTLNSATLETLDINGQTGHSLTVKTLNHYIAYVYQAIGGPKLRIYENPLQENIRRENMKEALESHKKQYGEHRLQNKDIKFWLQEIDWMKEMNISAEDMEYYLTIPRQGRGSEVRMSASDRVAAFQIFTAYDTITKRKKQGDWIDYAQYVVRHSQCIPDRLKFDHVLIDEAQDLSLVQMMAAMMFFRKDMVVAMDLNQRIFGKHWTPKQLGIESTTKKLTKSMRTTKQIDNLAESLRKNNDAYLGEDDKTIRAIPEREGPLPQIVHLRDVEEEKKYLIETIKAWLKESDKISIGLLAAKNKQIDTYAAWLTDAGIYSEIIQKESTFSMRKPGVKIASVHSAKGLEFVRVLIPQFIEGNFPYHFQPEGEEELQNFLVGARNLVYVGMTRARQSLTITYCGSKRSRFVGEMDATLYEFKDFAEDILNEPVGRSEKAADSNVKLPPKAAGQQLSKDGRDLVSYLRSRGMKVVDKRAIGGNLTVIGEKADIEPVVKEVEKLYGAYGKYAASLKAAQNGPGWWTKCTK